MVISLSNSGEVYAANEMTPTETKELLMERILFQHYARNLLNITEKLYDCKKIINIKRIDNKHLIKVGLTTFTGAHNPPNDLYIITFQDIPGLSLEQPFEFHLENVDRVKNISEEQYRDFCK